MVDTIFPLYERTKGMEIPHKNEPVKAFIHIYLTEKTEGKGKVVIKSIAKALSKESIVEETSIVAGECDIILKVTASNVFALGKFISENLRGYQGIQKTVTSIVLESVK